MSWIDLLNEFYDLLQSTRVSGNAQLLYYTLLQINNKCGWGKWFRRTNVNLSGMMGVGEKALTNARNELKQLGLIDFIASKKRGECTKYCILYQSKSGTNAVQTQYKGSTNAVQRADINRLKTKDKEKEHTPIVPFREFWDIYPRRQAKAAAEKAYAKINPSKELFAKIQKALEGQKASFDWQKENGRYIPLPATWLNGKRWEDDLSVSTTRTSSSKATYDLSKYEETDLEDYL